MPEFGESPPLNPLYPVTPSRRPGRRERPEHPGQKERKREGPLQDEDNGKPHIDEYA
jgi:hypothetical protein